MSETEYKNGKLIPMDIEGDNLERQAEKVCEVMGYEKKEYYDSYLEVVDDLGSDEVYILNGTFYKVENKDVNSYDDIFEADLNPDGTISYILKYYNGGCGFNEALDEAVKKIKEES